MVKLSDELVARNADISPGTFCYIAYNTSLGTWLEEQYGRTGLCLKIFTSGTRLWQSNPLATCSIIQNLFARRNLAPRIYGLVWLSRQELWAQVTDFISGPKGGALDRDSIAEVQAEYGLKNNWDMNPKNYIGGQMVDFQSWYFVNQDAYLEQLVERAYSLAAWGSREEPYQGVPGLLEESQRDIAKRRISLELHRVDFAHKSVLDIGCNLGMMSVEAWQRGASRVTGVDVPAVAQIAFEINNWTEIWNIDFIGATLPQEREKLEKNYDIVLALSCNQSKPFPWAFALCNETLILEGHVPQREETYREMLEAYFTTSVEYLGMSRDHGPRPVFRCTK